MYAAELEERGVVRVSGPDARSFLQGLVSNDIERVRPDRAAYALLLSPQGKILFDFIVVEQEGAFLLDCEKRRAAQLMQRLTLYKLRAKVAITEETEAWRVAVHWGAGAASQSNLPAEAGASRAEGGTILFVDPRLAELGVRRLSPTRDRPAFVAGSEPATMADYTAHRFALGIGEGSSDFGIEALFALEANAEPLHAVDFRKGCYVGQELTARMKHRANVRKRLLPAQLDGRPPAPGSPISAGEKIVGAVCAVHDGRALVLLRIDHWTEAAKSGERMIAESAVLSVAVPDWLRPSLGEIPDTAVIRGAS